METFVREAIARAAFERGEALEKESGGGIAGDFLEVSKLHVKETVAQNVGTGLMMRGQVEDLEKLAPQLLLDF